MPQGTCLGPILFLFYINDITVNITSQMRLFADDALIYRPIHTAEDHIILFLQNDLLGYRGPSSAFPPGVVIRPGSCRLEVRYHPSSVQREGSQE